MYFVLQLLDTSFSVNVSDENKALQSWAVHRLQY